MIKRDIVECIIINKKKEILLQKKTSDYPILPGGYWCFFGGAIENGESPEEAIRREVKEELGLELTFKIFKVMTYKTQNYSGTDNIFVAQFNGDLSKISLSEGGGFAFFSEPELKDTKIAPINIPTFKEFFDKLKKN